MARNIVTPWSFRDGREYIISLAVGDSPDKNVSLNISDKITAEEWSCNYDSKYIEKLTHKTGSYKPFDTFISMIKSALLKKSDSVTLDLMSADDLAAIKHKKLQLEVLKRAQIGSPCGNFPGFSNQTDLYSSQKTSSGGDKKKYLIVTYIAEFDRVHYPIPMVYSGLPDTTIQQNNILKLQSEVSQLKSANCSLEKKLCQMRDKKSGKYSSSDSQKSKTHLISKEIGIGTADDCYSPRGNYKYSTECNKMNDISDNFPFSRNITEINSSEGGRMNNATGNGKVDNDYLQSTLENVLTIVSNLEERILAERAENLERMNLLQAENASLHIKLLDAQISETELKIAMRNLEKLLAKKSNQGREHYSFPNRCFSHNSIQTVKQSMKSNRERKFEGTNKKEHGVHTRPSSLEQMVVVNSGRNTPVYPRSRCSSLSSNKSAASRASNKSLSKNSRNRSVSPSRRFRPFDPTAYENEKKLKQEEMARLRISNIEARTRSRSTSRDREEIKRDNAQVYANYCPSSCSVCEEELKIHCSHEHNDRGRFHTQKTKNNPNHNLFHAEQSHANSGGIPKSFHLPIRVINTNTTIRSPEKKSIANNANTVWKSGDHRGVRKIASSPVRNKEAKNSQQHSRSPQKIDTLWKSGDTSELKSSSKNMTNFSRSNTEESLHALKNNRGNKEEKSEIIHPFQKYLDKDNSKASEEDKKHNHSPQNRTKEVDVKALETRLSALQKIIDSHPQYFTKTL